MSLKHKFKLAKMYLSLRILLPRYYSIFLRAARYIRLVKHNEGDSPAHWGSCLGMNIAIYVKPKFSLLYYYVLLHEIAHVLFRHSYVDRDEVFYQNEYEADAFAISVLNSIFALNKLDHICLSYVVDNRLNKTYTRDPNSSILLSLAEPNVQKEAKKFLRKIKKLFR